MTPSRDGTRARYERPSQTCSLRCRSCAGHAPLHCGPRLTNICQVGRQRLGRCSPDLDTSCSSSHERQNRARAPPTFSRSGQTSAEFGPLAAKLSSEVGASIGRMSFQVRPIWGNLQHALNVMQIGLHPAKVGQSRSTVGRVGEDKGRSGGST